MLMQKSRKRSHQDARRDIAVGAEYKFKDKLNTQRIKKDL